MIELFLERESAHKAAAERATQAKNWTALEKEARELVKVYGAIIISGMVDRSTIPDWECRRAKWTDIADRAHEAARRQGLKEPKTKDIQQPESPNRPSPPPRTEPGPAHVPQQQETLRLADVKGLAEAKQIVMDALVNPVKHPDIFKTLKIKSGKGLLLYGPPGTGKTMFARAVAGEMELPFIYKKVSDLKDKYVGESEKNVSALFAEAYSHKRSIVFIDECESLLRKRGNQKVNIVEAFLAELDGFATNRESQVFVLLATNRPWLIDSAVVRSGRIGAAVHIGLPDAETRRCIIESALKDVPLADDVDIDDLVASTEGYSGAELNHGDGGGVCNEARVLAGHRWVARRERLQPGDPDWNRVEKVTNEDFKTALKKVVPVCAKDPDIVRRNLEFSLGEGNGGDPGPTDDE